MITEYLFELKLNAIAIAILCKIADGPMNSFQNLNEINRRLQILSRTVIFFFNTVVCERLFSMISGKFAKIEFGIKSSVGENNCS